METAEEMRLMFLAGLLVLGIAIAVIARLSTVAHRNLAERLVAPAGRDERRAESGIVNAPGFGHRLEMKQARWRLLL
jgi:hypothetical protein